MFDIRVISEIMLFRVILGAFTLTFFGLLIGLIYKGIDRKIAAHMQGRVGPPLVQPFRDVRKLFNKENIVPDNAVPWLFHLAPVVGVAATIATLLYLPVLPIGGNNVLSPILAGYGDMILILYLLIIPSLMLVIGGFASGTPYAVVGAQREMATMIAYEFPLAIIIIGFSWYLKDKPNPFAVTTITSNPIWSNVGVFGLIGFIILLLVLIIVTPAELSKIPFDASEAETEIAGGLLVEYSGRNLAMFYLMDAVKTIVMAVIIVTLFFPYNLTGLPGLSNLSGTIPGGIIDTLFLLFKTLIIVFISVILIRVAIARLKIDQIVSTYWVHLTLLGLVALILIMIDRWVIAPSPNGLGWSTVSEMIKQII